MKISHSSTTVIFGLVFLSQNAIAQQDPSVVIAPRGNACPDGYVKLATRPGCEAAMTEVTLPVPNHDFQGREDEGAWPGGCYYCNEVGGCSDGVWFNENAVGAANGGARPICALPDWEDAGFSVEVETLFIGDSDIFRWSTQDLYPDSANVGVGGYTCDDVNQILDARLRDYKPDRVVIVCGENDLWDQGVSATFSDFQVAIGKIVASGARAVYLGTKPEPDTRELHAEYRQYDARIRNYVEALNANAPASSPPLVMVDVYPAFVETGNPRGLYARDGLHLSNQGYARWNTWTQTALADTSGCARWTNNVCVSTAPRPSPITPPPTTLPPTTSKTSKGTKGTKGGKGGNARRVRNSPFA